MKLAVSSIHFLKSGRISVEVRGETEENPPTPPAVDVVMLRLYMEFAPTDDIGELKERALKLARESIVGSS